VNLASSVGMPKCRSHASSREDPEAGPDGRHRDCSLPGRRDFPRLLSKEIIMKIRRTAASVIGALLVLGACGVAAAQQAPQQDPATATPQEPKQALFDRAKTTLKDQVQAAVTVADSHIGVLKKMQGTDKEATAQKRDQDMEKKLTDLRDGLQKDVDKIDKATPSDWSSVRGSVESDLKKMESEIKTAANVTHIAPTTGAANKQPPSK
jgi:hypothetical protein